LSSALPIGCCEFIRKRQNYHVHIFARFGQPEEITLDIVFAHNLALTHVFLRLLFDVV
jgi:hypothetical protein